jgi:hypothetical protein
MSSIINIPSRGAGSYKDSVQSIGDLPSSSNTGDVILVKDTGGLYYWNGSTWTYVVASDASGTTQYKPEAVRTLSGGDITAKQITLLDTPTNANKTRLTVIDGPMQEYGVDFSVSGAILSWNGLGLDGVLEVGDRLVITYN